MSYLSSMTLMDTKLSRGVSETHIPIEWDWSEITNYFFYIRFHSNYANEFLSSLIWFVNLSSSSSSSKPFQFDCALDAEVMMRGIVVVLSIPFNWILSITAKPSSTNITHTNENYWLNISIRNWNCRDHPSPSTSRGMNIPWLKLHIRVSSRIAWPISWHRLQLMQRYFKSNNTTHCIYTAPLSSGIVGHQTASGSD